jgi:uncharacterized membrane protein YhiD involved in acid resistance
MTFWTELLTLFGYISWTAITIVITLFVIIAIKPVFKWVMKQHIKWQKDEAKNTEDVIKNTKKDLKLHLEEIQEMI